MSQIMRTQVYIAVMDHESTRDEYNPWIFIIIYEIIVSNM